MYLVHPILKKLRELIFSHVFIYYYYAYRMVISHMTIKFHIRGKHQTSGNSAPQKLIPNWFNRYDINLTIDHFFWSS